MRLRHILLLAFISLLLGASMLLSASAAETDLFFNGERIAEVYSFDYPNRTYQRVTGHGDMRAVADCLAQLKPGGTFKRDSVGFLVFTEQGKYAFYLSESGDRSSVAKRGAIALSARLNKQYPRSAQWLAYMSAENIVEIQYSGFSGGPYYSQKTDVYPQEFPVDRTLTDPEEIARVVEYLKGIEVAPSPEVRVDDHYGVSSAAGTYSITIRFRSGVSYWIDGGFLTISSSGQREQISYTQGGDNDQIKGLRDLMADIATQGGDPQQIQALIDSMYSYERHLW